MQIRPIGSSTPKGSQLLPQFKPVQSTTPSDMLKISPKVNSVQSSPSKNQHLLHSDLISLSPQANQVQSNPSSSLLQNETAKYKPKPRQSQHFDLKTKSIVINREQDQSSSPQEEIVSHTPSQLFQTRTNSSPANQPSSSKYPSLTNKVTAKHLLSMETESESQITLKRSNHQIQTPETIDDYQPERINTFLGKEFYNSHPWISTKELQFHESELPKVISTSGQTAVKISHKFPPWYHFLFPAAESDRKNWSISVRGTTYVSTSKALRLERSFIIPDTILTICPICDNVMNNKYLVCMKYYPWKEDFSPSDLLNWQTDFTVACYIHWRETGSQHTPTRNPWKLSKVKQQNSNQSNYQKSSTQPAMGPSVLPSNIL